MGEPSLLLAPGRERSVERRHPWVFAGAVGRVEGAPEPGDTVAVRRRDGRFLAWAAYSPASQIVARVWTWDEDELVDEAFFASRIARAAAARVRPGRADRRHAGGLRRERRPARGGGRPLRHPRRRPAVVGGRRPLALGHRGRARRPPRCDRRVRALRCRHPGPGGAHGTHRTAGGRGAAGHGDDRRAPAGRRSGLDVRGRPRPAATRPGSTSISGRTGGWSPSWPPARRTLDLFCYTGGFSVAAGAGGSGPITAVDSSGPALDLGGDQPRAQRGRAASSWSRPTSSPTSASCGTGARAFDLIVADPPKLARSTSQLKRATRAYKDLNLLALKLLAPGGLLVTFSCSGLVTEDLFQKVLFGASPRRPSGRPDRRTA